MVIDCPIVSYLFLYIVSVYILETNSRTSTHWRLNADTGKVEIAALAADGDANSPFVTFRNDPLLNILTSRVSLANGEWKLEGEPQSCYGSCLAPDEPIKTLDDRNYTSAKTDATKALQKSEKRSGRVTLDCGKSISNSPVDHLKGVINRYNHPHVPEPEVAMIFRTKGSSEVDMVQLESQLKGAKKEKPKSSQVYNQIGNFWRIKGDTQRSIECFRHALFLSSNNSDALLNLARVLFNLHEYDDALELTKKSLENRGPEQNAWLQHFTLGEIHRAKGHRRDAAQHFHLTLDLHPSFHPALVHLQELEAELSGSGSGGDSDLGGSGGAAITYYTLFIILLLVMGVLCGVLTSVDTVFDDGDLTAAGVKTQRHFNRAMAMRSIKLGINPKLIRMRKQYGC